MWKKIFPVTIAFFLFAGNIWCSTGDVNDSLLIDSAMVLDEALSGLPQNCPGSIKLNQTLIDVAYYSTDGLIRKGQIVVDRRLAEDIKKVFQVAFQNKFPFASVIPISRFNWSDEVSMARNNTSGFNYREVTGGTKLSNHAYGFAVDINPLLNPYIKGEVTEPAGAVYDPRVPGTLTAQHVIVRTFLDLGWEWGGNWESLKDYQHFEKVIE